MVEEKGLNYPLKQVKEFHIAFNHPVGKEIHSLDSERKASRISWMQEELSEFKAAGKKENVNENIVDEIDAILDLTYFALGTLVEMGIENPQEFFDIIQKSNMDKLWPDGRPRYRNDDKVVKPHGWKPPEPEMIKLVELLKDGRE